ncbi:MAG: NAD-dependent deacylase [Polyangiaceae bacterium]
MKVETKRNPARGANYTELAPVEISASSRVFILTGAGISAESGIATFRDKNGLWEMHAVEDVASPQGWRKDAELVWKFYSERRAQAETCKPNVAHIALGELEKKIGDKLFLCTQNVDGLHELGGSKRVVHMHGELFKSRCEDAKCKVGISREDHALYPTLASIAKCECGSRLRPDICWFGEIPFFMDRISDALDACDLFVTVGSSGAVYPAAGFVRHVNAKRPRAKSIYVGPEEPDNADEFDECRLGKASAVLPGLFRVL